MTPRLYHVVAISTSTEEKTFLTTRPLDHDRACIMLDKFTVRPERRIQLEEVADPLPYTFAGLKVGDRVHLVSEIAATRLASEYTVEKVGKHGIDLRGPRKGRIALVQNIHDPMRIAAILGHTGSEPIVGIEVL